MTLNEVYSSLAARRRYEVWFVRLGMGDGSGAWWFRYLLTNPGRGGCPGDPSGSAVQVWATWFASGGKPQSFIQGFPLERLALSERGQSPFHFKVGENAMDEHSCRGHLEVDGRNISWDLRYASSFRTTLSSKGWIGFSRTPHSDSTFSGEIVFDGHKVQGQPLGFGLQGHNCGYRHRGFWIWTHAFFPRAGGTPTTLEALVYDMPLGLIFRKCVLWHEGRAYVFRGLRDLVREQTEPQWSFRCSAPDGLQLEASLDGRGPGVHRLPYVKTDCSGHFEVVNNSIASAVLRLSRLGSAVEQLQTTGGAVLEFGGQSPAKRG